MEGVPVLRILVGSAVAALVVGVLAALVLPASYTTAAPGRGSALLAEGERTLSPDTLDALEARPNWRRRPLKFGFAEDLPAHLHSLPVADRLGATVARTAIPWYFDNWEALDRAYESFFAYGVRPIFSVYVSRPPEPTASLATPPLPPAPAPSPSPHSPMPPAPQAGPPPPTPDVEHFKIDEYVAQVAYIAGRYPWAVIQILNEPNLEVFGGFSVDQTVDITVRSARAIHEASPGTRVIGPVSSPDHGRGYRYTKAVYSQLPPDLADVDAATHIYPGPKKAFKHVKKSVAIGESTGRRVWVTETAIGIYSPKRQRCKQIRRTYAYLRQRTDVRAILFFRLLEPDYSANVQGRLWVVNKNGTHTPLYRCLARG